VDAQLNAQLGEEVRHRVDAQLNVRIEDKEL
jgi:hypothetical protein